MNYVNVRNYSRRKKILIVVTCLLLTHIAHAQAIINKLETDSVKLIVEYYVYNGYVNQTTYTKRFPVKLFIGKKVYLTDIQIASAQEDSANISSQLSTPQNAMAKNMILENRNSNGIHSVTMREFGSPEFFTYRKANEKQLLIKDTAQFFWTLTSKIKKIDSFNCQQALGRYGTDSVEAWFTESIPLDAGPSKVYGLPGLILSYKNPTSKTYYQVISITTDINDYNNEFKKYSSASIINKSDYNKILAEQHRNIIKIQKMLQNGKIDKSNL